MNEVYIAKSLTEEHVFDSLKNAMESFRVRFFKVGDPLFKEKSAFVTIVYHPNNHAFIVGSIIRKTVYTSPSTIKSKFKSVPFKQSTRPK